MPFQNIGVATVYTNLGDDAVVHALNETGTEIVVTSHELLPRFRKMLPQVCINYFPKSSTKGLVGFTLRKV